MTTPDWLRPVSERFLAGDPGPPPTAVRVAVGLAVVNALAAAGMVVIWGGVIGRMLGASGSSGESLVHFPTVVLAAALALTGAGLCAVFTLSTVRLTGRGWCRLPRTAGLILGVLAVAGLCVLAAPPQLPGDQTPDQGSGGAGYLAPRLLATAAAGFAMALVLRTGAASSWLARRRYQRAGTGQDGGSGTDPTAQ